MPTALRFLITPVVGDRSVHVVQDETIEVGRQMRDEPPPTALYKTAAVTRLIVAGREETSIGRQQLRVALSGRTSVRLTNINSSNPVGIELGPPLLPGQSLERSLPVTLFLGRITVQIELEDIASDEEFQSLVHATPAPGHSLTQAVEEPFLRSTLNSADIARLAELIDALQIAASHPDFNTRIVTTARKLIGLDHAAVLVYDGASWSVAAQSGPSTVDELTWHPSRSLLEEVLRQRRALWRTAGELVSADAPSLQSVVAVVAAPILSATGIVIGAIYGDRRVSSASGSRPIDQIEAQLVEILACGVAGGRARLEQERTAQARRVQLERFVTREVAAQIEHEPELLTGRDAEVTLLFCDIAGFSSISQRLSPQKTFEWINDVMETLSGCVLASGGTLVDYVGDELIAMWGAPVLVADHAVAACRAALAMHAALNAVNSRWMPKLAEPTRIGIGLNSGWVRVGNTGSQVKWKYGPLGSEVNIASRVQGATRYLHTPILIAGATAERLPPEFDVRRLGAVRVKNIEQPLQLYELAPALSDSPSDEASNRHDLAERYQSALSLWETQQLTEAVPALSALVAAHRNDGPSLVLLARAIEAWSRNTSNYDPIWTLPGKWVGKRTKKLAAPKPHRSVRSASLDRPDALVLEGFSL